MRGLPFCLRRSFLGNMLPGLNAGIPESEVCSMAQPLHYTYEAHDGLDPHGAHLLCDYLPGTPYAQLWKLGDDYGVLINLDANALEGIAAWIGRVRLRMPQTGAPEPAG